LLALLVWQVTDASNTVLLENVADHINLSRLKDGWRKAIRKSYTKNIQPFVYGVPVVHLQLAVYFAVNELLHAHWATAAVYGVPDAIARCISGEGPGARPEDAAEADVADADESSDDEEAMPNVAVQDAGATADMPAPQSQGDA
jgi:hypothetical protein